MLPMQTELLRQEEVKYREKPVDDLNDVLVPISQPNMTIFSDAEREIIDRIFEELRPYNATAVSDYSHLRSAGWNVREDREDIPYESAFVSTDPAPAEAIELGRQLAAQYGW